MSTRIHIVNFGQSYGGLATVGYTILNIDGTTKVSRATSGIVEYGASTGIYGANITYNEFDQLVVLWDTGGASPRYAVEENRTTLASIQEGTDFIRMIWNTLKNQGEIFGKILNAVKEMEKHKNYDPEFKSLAENLKSLIKREEITLKDIKDSLKITVPTPNVTVPAPVVNIQAPIVTVKPTPVTVTPTKVTVQEREIKIPDYTSQIEGIKTAIDSLANQAHPKLKDLSGEIENIKQLVMELERFQSGNHDKTNKNLSVVNENVRSVGSAMQDLLKVIPPSQLLMVLKDSLSAMMDEERKNNSLKLKNTLRV